jgi:hypothetical protein
MTHKIKCRECGKAFAIRNEIVIKKTKGSLLDDFEITGLCSACNSKWVQSQPEGVQDTILDDLFNAFGMKK